MSKKSKMVFSSVAGGPLSHAKAQLAGKQFSELQKSDGAVTPKRVVEVNRPASAPLHDCFEWDNKVAAEEYRLGQARRIIRSVVIVREDMPKAEQPVVRAFLHVKAEENESRFEGQAYVSHATVQKNESYKQQVLTEAKAELKSWAQRYEDLKASLEGRELAGVFNAIEDIEEG